MMVFSRGKSGCTHVRSLRGFLLAIISAKFAWQHLEKFGV
jgi:hypothetical protein